MNNLIKSIRINFFLSFEMLEKLIEQTPDEIFNIKAGGFIYWQQLLHALSGAHYWMRRPESSFSELFPERKLYPELDNDPYGNITKAELIEYKNSIKALCETFFNGKDDEFLLKPSGIYDKISNLDIVLMQIRHIQYHVGHCNSILRGKGLKAVQWIDYMGE